jgi:uncharacterized protein YcfL
MIRILLVALLLVVGCSSEQKEADQERPDRPAYDVQKYGGGE